MDLQRSGDAAPHYSESTWHLQYDTIRINAECHLACETHAIRPMTGAATWLASRLTMKECIWLKIFCVSRSESARSGSYSKYAMLVCGVTTAAVHPSQSCQISAVETWDCLWLCFRADEGVRLHVSQTSAFHRFRIRYLSSGSSIVGFSSPTPITDACFQSPSYSQLQVMLKLSAYSKIALRVRLSCPDSCEIARLEDDTLLAALLGRRL